MNHDLELQLYKKYPKILQDCGKSPMESCMSFWMECDDGWYELLDKCMEKFQYFCDICSKDGREVQVVANQIKEKYSTLRFYVSVYGASSIENDIIDDIISEAEKKSAYTCEITGKHGEPCKKGGWYKTLCYEEARKLGYEACDSGTEEYWKKKDSKQED
jgi:hypothetical protein